MPMPETTERVRVRRVDVGGLLFRAVSSAAQPRRRTFVLLHGIGVSHRYLARLHQALSGVAAVHSIDMPGFGGLPKPELSPDVASMARAIGVVLDELDVTDCIVVGHSMGAQWATELAASRPDIVRAVVAIGPVADDAHRTVWEQNLALGLDILGEPFAGIAVVLPDYIRCGPPWYLQQVRHMLQYRLEDRVGDLQVPLLIIRGGNDHIVGMPWSRRLRDRARESVLVTIPGHRHLVQWSAPRATAEAILAFVEEHSVG